MQWKHFWIALGVAATLLFALWLYRKSRRDSMMTMVNGTKEFFGKLLWSHQLREDDAGSGKYDPIAQGGPRPTEKHEGVDLITGPGHVVYSPMDARVTRKAFPYPGDLVYEGLVLDGVGEYDGFRFKIFYILPDWTSEQLKEGVEVKKGQRIGVAQAISQRYPGQGMKDHIHVEMYAMGVLQDPTPVLFPSQA